MAAPFNARIMDTPLPKEFKLPTIKAYVGTSDPRAHMTRYKAAMVMMGAEDDIICRAFLSTLDWAAQDWFNTIPYGLIQNFGELSKSFLSYFSDNIQCKRLFSHLYAVRQDKGENLKDFLNKWKMEVSNVHDLDSKATIFIFIQALTSGDFHRQLNGHHPRSYEELMRIVNRYAEIEETDRKKKDEEEGRRGGQPNKVGPTNQAPRPNQSSTTKGRDHERPHLVPLRHLTPLTHSVGHDTNECHILKGQIEELVQNEYFTQFVKYPQQQYQQQGQPGNVWRKEEDLEPSASNTKKKRYDQHNL
ncbi:uncharacterized protein LOC116015887 [Ipomoea triloba]|uniref:uncharacterized protein LOC116015887 n=1 Tax=Ipomoea triloba TaxID=35885 RepID=UPI00125D00FA|nr:uncharacterized protein LOC116015887 [Ipomoea triloba]